MTRHRGRLTATGGAIAGDTVADKSRRRDCGWWHHGKQMNANQSNTKSSRGDLLIAAAAAANKH